MQEVLGHDDFVRFMHDVPLFEWDADIQARAQSRAENGFFLTYTIQRWRTTR